MELTTIEDLGFADVSNVVVAIRNNEPVDYYLLPMLVPSDLDRVTVVRYLLKQFEVVRRPENRHLRGSWVSVLGRLVEKSDFPAIERMLT